MQRQLAAAATAFFILLAPQEADACEGPPWSTIGAAAPDGQVAALWGGILYRINSSDGRFTEIAKAPDGGSPCFMDGQLYAVTVARLPPTPVAILKAAPLLIVEPHQDVRPSISRVDAGGLVNVVEGPRLAYHYGAAPLTGARAVFLGYRHGAMIVADQDGAVWKRQAVGDPTISQSPAGLGVGAGGSIHTLILTRREAVVTTFDGAGRVTKSVRLDLPQDYRSARVDRRFVKLLGEAADQTYFWVSAGRHDRGEGRSSLAPLLIAVGRDGSAGLRQAPSALADTCSGQHMAINHDRVAVLCKVLRRPVVALWSLASGDVRHIEVANGFLSPSGYVKASVILAPAHGADFTLMALDSEGDGPALRAVQLQPIG